MTTISSGKTREFGPCVLRLLWRGVIVPLFIGFLIAGVGGCTADDQEAPGHVDDLPRFMATVERVLGDFDDPDVGFSRVSRVEVDEDGNLYVLEGLSLEIRVYNPRGELVRRIGRKGEGPGEFQGLPRFGVLGDTVWTVDNRSMRITLFDREGGIISTGRVQEVLVPLPGGFGRIVPWYMRPSGKFSSHFGSVNFSRDAATDVKPTDSIPFPLILFDASGAVTDTVAWAPRPPPRLWRPPSEASPGPELIDVGGRRAWVPTPPSTLPWWLPLIDGYIIVETPTPETSSGASFAVTRTGAESDTVYRRSLHYTPERYTPEHLDSIAVWAARGDPRGMAPYVPGQSSPTDWEVVANRLRAVMEFPEFRLPIDFPWLAQDGSVWLKRSGSGAQDMAEWIIVDPVGELRGVVPLPSDAYPQWSRGDTVWAVDPDEFDVPWLKRFVFRVLEN